MYSVVLKQIVPMVGSDEIYVDLCEEDNTQDPNTPVMAVLHNFQQEMAELGS